MKIRYSAAYSAFMAGIGGFLLLMNTALLRYGSTDVIGFGTGVFLLLIGLASWGRAFVVINDGEFAVQNLLGMRFRKTPVSDLTVEPVGKKRRLYRVKKNGKRQRVLTAPNWMFNSNDAEALLDAVSSAGVFD